MIIIRTTKDFFYIYIYCSLSPFSSSYINLKQGINSG